MAVLGPSQRPTSADRRGSAGGGRRSYSVCSPTAGTYQAFFSGVDANGNGLRVSSPVVTFAP